MPKQLLHDLFANHVDYKNGIGNDEKPHLNQLSFHCQVDHFVVETPFTYEQKTILVTLLFKYLPYRSSVYHYTAIEYTSQIDLRGPPVI